MDPVILLIAPPAWVPMCAGSSSEPIGCGWNVGGCVGVGKPFFIAVSFRDRN